MSPCRRHPQKDADTDRLRPAADGETTAEGGAEEAGHSGAGMPKELVISLSHLVSAGRYLALHYLLGHPCRLSSSCSSLTWPFADNNNMQQALLLLLVVAAVCSVAFSRPHYKGKGFVLYSTSAILPSCHPR